MRLTLLNLVWLELIIPKKSHILMDWSSLGVGSWPMVDLRIPHENSRIISFWH